MKDNSKLSGRTALVTGSAKRLGAEIARALHAEGMNLLLHYNRSEAEAQALAAELNALRADSAAVAQADLANTQGLDSLVKAALQWQGLDVLVNNASAFRPTPIGNVVEDDWDEIMASNLKAPFFLSQAAAVHLKKNQGCIVNMLDIYGRIPRRDHALYCISKAGLEMLTRALALDLGPDVRVNGIAPGVILWPESGLDPKLKKSILDKTALKRVGSTADVTGALLYLVRDAEYVTGHVLAVDGGRSLGN